MQFVREGITAPHRGNHTGLGGGTVAWIESHQSLGKHPKTKRLARSLGVPLPMAVGLLQFLWWWALDFAEDGDLSRFEDLEIAQECLWEGEPSDLVTALMEVGFLDPDRKIHDWDAYAGKLITQRRRNRERVQGYRDRQKTSGPSSSSKPTPDVMRTDSLRNENETGTKRECNASTVPMTVPNQTNVEEEKAPAPENGDDPWIGAVGDKYSQLTGQMLGGSDQVLLGQAVATYRGAGLALDSMLATMERAKAAHRPTEMDPSIRSLKWFRAFWSKDVAGAQAAAEASGLKLARDSPQQPGGEGRYSHLYERGDTS